jgi:4-diphosphocytidyl-2-C-methyl-D-erythritol kinase
VVEGEFAQSAPANDSNLVMRAATLLASVYPENAKFGGTLTLQKQVPAGAGLGGGSADAAAALRLLNRVWHIGTNEDSLAGLAAQLGADVPVCIYNQPAWARGVGDDVSLMPAGKSLPLLVIYPGVPLATADVFRSYSPPFSAQSLHWPPSAPDESDMATWHNDLEMPAKTLCPSVTDVLAVLARTGSRDDQMCGFGMSGSGSSCYALCRDYVAIQHLALQLRTMYQPSWVYEGWLQTPFV